MTTWTDLVKKVYREGQAHSKTFKLKDAMKKAKTLYRKGTSSIMGKKSSRKRRRTRRKR
jgi:hypothetical protein